MNIEQMLRLEAMKLAIDYAKGGTSENMPEAEIVKMAEAFYQFLTTKSDA